MQSEFKDLTSQTYNVFSGTIIYGENTEHNVFFYRHCCKITEKKNHH